MARILVCGEADMAPGDARKLDVRPPVTLFRADNGYFAIDDTCTHGQASLAEGFVDGETVECPLHMAQFCLRTGRALSAPADAPVASHKVVIIAAQVFVDIER